MYRTKRISIRTTPKIKSKLNRICKNNHIKKSKFLDECVIYIGKQDIKTMKIQSKKDNQIFHSDSHIITQLEAINSQITRLGNNLNQIARGVNKGIVSPNLVQIINDTRQICNWTIQKESSLENEFSNARK